MIWEQKCILVITFSDSTEICEVCIYMYTNSLSIDLSIYMVVFAHIELNASPLVRRTASATGQLPLTATACSFRGGYRI